MPITALQPYQWRLVNVLVNENSLSAAGKVHEIYKILRLARDPPIPDDFESNAQYEHLFTSILESARDENLEQELLSAVGDLIDAIKRRDSPRTGQKRTRSEATSDSELELDNGISTLELDEGDGEMLGALNADDSHFDRPVLPTNDYAPTRGQRKRAKEAQEPKPYVDLNTILVSQPFEELMTMVENGLADFIDTYSGSLPLWDPEPVWKDCPEVLARLRALNIPHVPLGGNTAPDMLLAALGTGQLLDEEIRMRIRQLMDDTCRSWNLLNASGSGKTRLFFEMLARHWAFYFACAHDAVRSPYGSKDIVIALKIIADRSVGHRHRTDCDGVFAPNLETTEELLDAMTDAKVEAINAQRETNRGIAEHIFHVVVLARTLVFESFLACWQRAEKAKQSKSAKRRGAKATTATSGGDPTPRPRARPKYNHRTRDQTLEKLFEGGISNPAAAIRTWAYLQICPHLVLPGSSSDVFCRLLDTLQWASHTSASAQTEERLRLLLTGAGIELEAVMFDEVQALASTWSSAFGPEEDNLTAGESIRARAMISRPVLKPLTLAVMTLVPTTTKCLLASTKFNEFLINEAIISGLLKGTGLPQRFVTFGDQGTPRKVAGTLRRFFGDAFLKEALDHELWDELKYWLIGRHRFLMVFIQFVLRTGPTSMRNVFRNILWRLTGYRPPGFSQIFSMDQSRLLSSSHKLRERITSNENNVACIREIVYTWIFNGRYPLMAEADIELVTLGIGRLVAEAGTVSSVQGVSTSENLIAAALFHWLDTDEKAQSTQFMIYRELSSIEPSSRGFALENSLVYLFWHAFAAGGRLEDVFDFAYLPPSWRGQKAHLVDVCRKHSGTGFTRLLDRGLTTRLAWRTDNIPATLAWFRRGGLSNLRVPFLRPDNYIGPDLLFILRLASGEEILVCVQSKAWSHKRSANEVLTEAWKLPPERYYGTDKVLKKAWQKDAVARHQSAVRAHLDDMLLPSALDMSFPGGAVENKSEFAYDPAPKYPVLRVFAAYEGSYARPDTTPGAMGQYPLAFLSNKFLAKARKMFPSMDAAARAVAEHRAEMEEEQRRKKEKAAAERAKLLAEIEEEDELDDELLGLIGDSAPEQRTEALARSEDEINTLLLDLDGRT